MQEQEEKMDQMKWLEHVEMIWIEMAQIHLLQVTEALCCEKCLAWNCQLENEQKER